MSLKSSRFQLTNDGNNNPIELAIDLTKQLSKSIATVPVSEDSLEEKEEKHELTLDSNSDQEEEDSNLVTWDANDPLNPMNLSHGRKFFLIFIISANTFVTYASVFVNLS